MNDEHILRGVQNRDQNALKALMDRYISYVSTIVWNILRSRMSRQDAEEVVSDVFLAAWNQADSIQPVYLKAWLGAVARNMAKNKLRHMGFVLPLEGDTLELPGEGSPASALEQEEEAALVRRAVESMGEPEREIFLHYYYFAQTLKEITMKK